MVFILSTERDLAGDSQETLRPILTILYVVIFAVFSLGFTVR